MAIVCCAAAAYSRCIPHPPPPSPMCILRGLLYCSNNQESFFLSIYIVDCDMLLLLKSKGFVGSVCLSFLKGFVRFFPK